MPLTAMLDRTPPPLPAAVPSRRGRRGVATRRRLVAAARKLFLSRGYRAVTLPQIARAARLSAGAPYQHFTGKDQLFQELARGLGERLAAAIGTPADAKDAPSPLDTLYARLLESLDSERELFQLAREAEFAIGQDSSVALEPVIRALEAWVPRTALPSERRILAWSLFSLAYFPAIARSLWREADAPTADAAHQELARFAARGLAPGSPARQVTAKPGRRQPRVTPPETLPTVREGLLASAESRFAVRGFQACTLEELARAGGLTVSGLLLHFPGKEALLGEVVARIRDDLAANVRVAAAPFAHRADVEEAALRGFFDFLKRRPGVYRVVREAEFVLPRTGREYYRSLWRPYAAGLAAAADRAEIETGDAPVTALALMGLGHWLGLLGIVDRALPVARTLAVATRFLRHGFEAFAASASPSHTPRSTRRPSRARGVS